MRMAQGDKFKLGFLAGGVYAEQVKHSSGKFIILAAAKTSDGILYKNELRSVTVGVDMSVNIFGTWRAWNGFLFW